MPATDAQFLANRRNSLLSTGPVTEAGQATSRLNATTHGLTGSSVAVEAARSPEFQDRRARWAAEHKPVGESANHALDRAVAATFRIERCERAIETHIGNFQMRAKLAWDEDRAVEAATIAARLPKNPVLASRQLRTTLTGAVLLIEAWLRLASVLESGDWSEGEASKALDLLGVDPDSRSGRTPIDGPGGTNPIAFRRDLSRREIGRLQALRDDVLTPLDALDRENAMAGGTALLTKEAKLLLRYERDAWKHFNQSMKEVRASAQIPEPAVASHPTQIREKAAAPPSRSETERRAVRAEAAPSAKPAVGRLIDQEFADDEAWFEELTRRTAAASLHRPGNSIPVAAARVGSR